MLNVKPGKFRNTNHQYAPIYGSRERESGNNRDRMMTIFWLHRIYAATLLLFRGANGSTVGPSTREIQRVSCRISGPYGRPVLGVSLYQGYFIQSSGEEESETAQSTATLQTSMKEAGTLVLDEKYSHNGHPWPTKH